MFSLAIFFLVIVSLFSVSVNLVYASRGDGFIEVDVPTRGTFLHAIEGYPYDGAGTRVHDENLDVDVIVGSYYSVESPAIVDLNAEGFTEGDRIIISFTASVYYSGTYNPSNPDVSGFPEKNENNLFWGGLLGVFSTTSALRDIKETDRVPDAVNSGTTTFITPTTKWNDALKSIGDKLASKGIRWYNGPEDTDIQYDFKIGSPYGYEITIPRNARFLFLCCIDDMYYDNLGEIKVEIEKDTDLDGIPDQWEINGIDLDEDGIVDLNLPVLGADWQHKDVFVEVDYMNHFRPNQFALDAVIDAFDKSPVTNPDMASGVNLHIIVDEEIPYKEVISDFDEFYRLKTTYFGTHDERTEQKTIEAKKRIFRYCLSVDKIWFNTPAYNCPGVSEGIACDDFIVAYGAFSMNTVEKQAAIFMHELGHCLGLDHGGGDDQNYKPNYLSIMNYRFQYANLLASRPLDYSRKELPPIDETNLNEAAGIGEATKTAWYEISNIPNKYCVSNGEVAIDWNVDGNITSGLLLDLNYDKSLLGVDYSKFETLIGYNDWANLIYRFRGRPLYRRSATLDDYHIELTDSEIKQREEDAKNIVEVHTPESYQPANEKHNVEIDLSSRATFLRADPFQGLPSGGATVEGPLIIDLEVEGFKEGDSISISYSGTIYISAYWNTNDLGESVSAENLALIGVFSTTNILESTDNPNRIPGAIDYGKDYETGKTQFNLYDTNIQEDFKIEPNTGFTLQIPKNAKYLFLCISDSFYPDNVGTIKISIEPSEWSDFLGELTNLISTPSVELIIIIAVGLSAIILVLLLLNKRRNKKDEKPLEIIDVK